MEDKLPCPHCHELTVPFIAVATMPEPVPDIPNAFLAWCCSNCQSVHRLEEFSIEFSGIRISVKALNGFEPDA